MDNLPLEDKYTEIKNGRVISQDDWKRTQIRMPMPLYDDLMDYASKHNISLNQAMIELIDRSLLNQPSLHKKFIFTEWRPTNLIQYNDPKKNEEVRKACAKFMTEFFTNYPKHELIKFDEITGVNKWGTEVILGIRIWYTYPD